MIKKESFTEPTHNITQWTSLGATAKNDSKKPLNYDEWLGSHEEDLQILAAETGADREMDFNYETYLEEAYETYRKERRY